MIEIKRLDFQVTNHGNIFLIRPLTPQARMWIDDNCAYEDWQWWFGALSVDWHYVEVC